MWCVFMCLCVCECITKNNWIEKIIITLEMKSKQYMQRRISRIFRKVYRKFCPKYTANFPEVEN